MGGFGSGRPALHPTCEASLRIDLAEPAMRAALSPNQSRTGTWQWSSGGRQIASIGYYWSPALAQLTLQYVHDGVPTRQHVKIQESVPRFGGHRYWLVCPFTHKRVRALFLPHGARYWGSRCYYQLRYQSQRERDLGAVMLRWLSRQVGHDAEGFREPTFVRDPLGFKEEMRWEARAMALARRNHIRRLRRKERARARAK